MKESFRNGWKLNESSIEIDLHNFYVSVFPFIVNDHILYKAVIGDRNNDKYHFNFKTLEDALNFVEYEVVNCSSFEEILYRYFTTDYHNKLILKK